MTKLNKIKRKWDDIQSEYDDELLTLIHTPKTDKTHLERLDGILYGIAFTVTAAHSLNHGRVSKDFVYKFLNDMTK